MAPKLIAFHLPQFHPIPENDAWWGKGFTEWTNVTRARPLYPGHHQPQLPADLGFYDLRLPEARQAQADLAREYGIHGFCYYHYWFNGKRLLERPVAEILSSGEPDFPFCLCWANENWTRRWDGAEQEVLIAQNYNDEDDLQHIRALIPMFKDPRYIRIDGKPLFLIYRAKHLPNPKRTLQIWRAEARRAGLGELFLCRVENFFNERDDPHALGFDASVDFQPDWMAIRGDVPSQVLENGHYVVDYRDVVESELARPPVSHLRFPGVTPGWDNSARRKKNAFIIDNSTPEAYEYWLAETLKTLRDRPASQQILFINAWNEWAEGNHLEPDQKSGRAYLEATRRALQRSEAPSALKPPPLLDPLDHSGFVRSRHYQQWIEKQALSSLQIELHNQRLARHTTPKFQLFIDATRCNSAQLSRTLNSISQQIYERWQVELLTTQSAPQQLNSARLKWHTCQADDVSGTLAQLAGRDECDFITLLQGGEVLKQDALIRVAQDLITQPDTDVVLTDGDRRDPEQHPVSTWLAPGWNPDWLRATLKVGGLIFARPTVVLAALDDIEASHSLALPLAVMLRALDGTQARHLAGITVHRPTELPELPLEFRAQLLLRHLSRCGVEATLEHGLMDDTCRVLYHHTSEPVSVDILVTQPGSVQDILHTVEKVLGQTTDLAVNVLIAHPPGLATELNDCLDQLAALNSPRIQVIPTETAGFADSVNTLARHARADYLLLLACGLAPLDNEWLPALLNHARRPDIGVTGGRVVGPDGTLTAGMVKFSGPGYRNTYGQGLAATYVGCGGELQLEQNCLAVSPAFAMVKRTHLETVGGLRDTSQTGTHAFSDLCLRLFEQGLRTLWTPHALMTCPDHAQACSESAPGAADEAFLRTWLPRLKRDPYSNPQLAPTTGVPRLQPDIALAYDPLPWKPLPRIYAHPADLTGSGEIRILTPLKALSRAGLIQGSAGTAFLHPWDLAGLAPDAIVTQRVHSDAGLAWLKSYKLQSDSLLIYELDDLIGALPADNAQRHGFPTDIHERIARGVALCDRLVVSTEPLAHAYGRHAADVRIAPNRLDAAVWGELTALPNVSARPRVGWAGSVNRVGDLMLLQEVVRATAKEVDWVFMGYCPDALRPLIREFHPGVPVQDYPRALAELRLDIAVAPLVANAFNEAKSNLKLLEYGALGYPVVCSNLLPYQGTLSVIRVGNTPQQWTRAIRELAHDAPQRNALGSTLQQEVRQNWMIQSHLDAWLEAWTQKN